MCMCEICGASPALDCRCADLPDEEYERLLNAKIRTKALALPALDALMTLDMLGIKVDPGFFFPTLSQDFPVETVAIKKYRAIPKEVDHLTNFKWKLDYDFCAVKKNDFPKYSVNDIKKLLVGVGVSNIDLENLTDEEIDEFIKAVKDECNHLGPVRPVDKTLPPNAIAPTKEELRTQRKRDGLCLDCGDRGEFVGTACMCRNGHGKIFG